MWALNVWRDDGWWAISESKHRANRRGGKQPFVVFAYEVGGANTPYIIGA